MSLGRRTLSYLCWSKYLEVKSHDGDHLPEDNLTKCTGIHVGTEFIRRGYGIYHVAVFRKKIIDKKPMSFSNIPKKASYKEVNSQESSVNQAKE